MDPETLTKLFNKSVDTNCERKIVKPQPCILVNVEKNDSKPENEKNGLEYIDLGSISRKGPLVQFSETIQQILQ